MTTHAHRSERPPATPLSSFESAGERTFPRPEALRPHLAAGLPHARNRYSRITVLGIRARLTHCNSSHGGDIVSCALSPSADMRRWSAA